jgi:hypothetical protein
MALCFLLDEHLRGPLWQAIQQHNATGVNVLDVVRVGDPPAPPLGTADPDLLVWGEAHGRILVSEDKRTLPLHLQFHFQAGRHIPGLLILLGGWTIPAVIDALVLRDQVLEPPDMVDVVEYIS